MHCGLLGRKLGHSYSPQIHRYLGSYSYTLFEKEPEEVESFLRSGDFSAINVTIPYKKTVMPYLDALSPTAKKLGCVNTIVRRRDGTLFGHNTDYFGFTSLVHHSGIAVDGRKVLVLGSGGTSNTAVKALEDQGAKVVVISRSGPDDYAHLSRHQDASVIVNTTPVGMYPGNGAAPVDLAAFPHLEGVLDVIYNPAKTQLLLDAERLGLPHANGLWMLVAQAKEAAEYFLNAPLDDGCIARVHRAMRLEMENIVLIGMPGCGKTTVGGALSELMHRPLVDADAEIEKLAGKTILELFASDGEAAFRRLETQVLAQLGKQSGLIIATGGGCVTQPCNAPLLRQNGVLVWLGRDLDELSTQGRPLSQSADLHQMYAQRQPLYQAFHHVYVENCGTPMETAQRILQKLEETL